LTHFCLKLYRERHSITRHYSAELQTTEQTLTTSKYTQLNLLTVTFLAILKWIGISLRWLIVDGSVKRAKSDHYRFSLTKIDQHVNFIRAVSAVTVTVARDRNIRTALRTNQIAGFVTVPSWEKINRFIYWKP